MRAQLAAALPLACALAGFGCGGDPVPTGSALGTSSGIGASSPGDTEGNSAGTTGGPIGTTGGPPPMPEGPHLDVLIVVDDGPTMFEEQANVARNFIVIAERLESFTNAYGELLDADTQVMVVHTSIGTTACSGPGGGGIPVSTSCRDRIADFSDPATGDASEACDSVCPQSVAPSAAFIQFDAAGNNIVGATDVDLDGDGASESAVAQALACIGPQGISGCRYGSTLEAMRAALEPSAPWNEAAEPFLRPGVPIAIIVISDGLDCSGADATTLDDPAHWNVDPLTGQPAPSEALCWNAGVQCDGPDAAGTFTECQSLAEPLTPTSEYSGFLDGLRTSMNKEVFLLGAVGVPRVTEHNTVQPFQPEEGGVAALRIHEWTERDLLADDVATGVTAADKQFELGVGPGCSGTVDGQVIGQATPPQRVIEVCQSLDRDIDTSDTKIRCCLESVCDESFDAVTNCLYALVPQVFAE